MSTKGSDVNAESIKMLEDAVSLLENKDPVTKDNLFAKKMLEIDHQKKVMDGESSSSESLFSKMFWSSKKKPLPKVDENEDEESDDDKRIYDVVEEDKEELSEGEILRNSSNKQALKDSVLGGKGLAKPVMANSFTLVLEEILAIINSASTA